MTRIGRSAVVSEQEEDFAAMFEASVKARQFDPRPDHRRHHRRVRPEGGLRQTWAARARPRSTSTELKDADGDVEVSVGDRIQAMVVSTSGGIVLSRKGVRNAATQRELEDAFQAGLAVEGKVEKRREGRLRSAHRPRARVLSASRRSTSSAPRTRRCTKGRSTRSASSSTRTAGKTSCVSRRKHLEEQQRASAADVRKSIVPGAVLTGRVASVPAFGAFVDLGGGIQGLLHVSEMSWSRVTNPSEIVAPGDQITVKVLRVDDGDAEDLARAEAAPGRSVDDGGRHVRGGPGAHGPRHARGGLRRLRGARAGHRRVGARVHVCPDGSRRRLGEVGARGHRPGRSRS